ncbi:MAG: hypothetical protein ACREGI_04635, partial [Candidatus Levyibacteriota bacterium]
LTTLKQQATVTKLTEISTPNSQNIISTVNAERRLSIHTPLTNIFSNKIIVWGKDSLNRYIQSFSFDLLFVTGEGRSTFSLWYHGYFYYLDLVFLFFGLYYLFRYKKDAGIILLALTLLAPIPAVVNSVETGFVALRASLLFPMYMIFIGAGIWYSIAIINKQSIKIAYSVILFLLYSFLFINFFNIYFFRNPIYNSDAFGLSGRILAKYLSFDKTNQVFIINGNPSIPFKENLFYTNSYNKDTIATVANAFKSNNFSYNNLHFMTCSEVKNIPQDATVIFENGTCKKLPKTGSTITIAQLSDSGAIYTIANDTVCNKFSLNHYISNITLSDLSVEQLSLQKFCQTFLIRY